MNKHTVDTLLALDQTLRAIHAARGSAPWLGLDLTMAQLKLLLVLVRTGGLPSRAIGQRLGMRPSAVTPLVDRLVSHKLARREGDPDDRRVVHVRPTARAVSLQETLMQTGRSVFEQVVDQIPASQRTAVQEALAALLDGATRVLARTQEKVTAR